MDSIVSIPSSRNSSRATSPLEHTNSTANATPISRQTPKGRSSSVDLTRSDSVAPALEVSKPEAALQYFQKLELLQLVRELVEKVASGVVTAKAVDNEAGTIRSRISKARSALQDLEGLDQSMGQRKETIESLKKEIERKRNLLRRFQAVMGVEITSQDRQEKKEPLDVDMKTERTSTDGPIISHDLNVGSDPVIDIKKEDDAKHVTFNEPDGQGKPIDEIKTENLNDDERPAILSDNTNDNNEQIDLTPDHVIDHVTDHVTDRVTDHATDHATDHTTNQDDLIQEDNQPDNQSESIPTLTNPNDLLESFSFDNSHDIKSEIDPLGDVDMSLDFPDITEDMDTNLNQPDGQNQMNIDSIDLDDFTNSGNLQSMGIDIDSLDLDMSEM